MMVCHCVSRPEGSSLVTEADDVLLRSAGYRLGKYEEEWRLYGRIDEGGIR